ncbi:2-hydroxy-3-oxopropionate reductase [Thiorhodococcus mannitoliphagus]|uniref:2-hydroxy-3-oxopropionate reductase n=1 Tax=Thiorhodococcus mannitoliphagus TaxID=329406 RepID=A0A6P1DNX2_9GAMM|nr:2-hydroxy-3-oxopropionate reductase [Thiorhodococcus mannitoliphagus]NEX18893.1 2-hydroxy-3-oxopropionate reductase [Thiorhodococcus mannitoliphagus]
MSEILGFIGLGIMGRPMALNLLRAGHELQVHARRAASMQPLADAGAQTCASPAEVARRADVIFTMVADTPDVEAVILGEQGVIQGARPGSVIVDMSTISASATRRIAERLGERGVEMLDAPVSGGEAGAIEGKLSIMVGGSQGAFRRVLPLLQVMGQNVVHIGDIGAGQVCKSCNQVVVGATIAGVAEAILLAQASGVDAARVREALLGGFANSRVLEVHGQRMIDDDFKPGFKARLHQKDMRILGEAAAELGLCLPSAAMISQYLNALVGQGLGDLDSAAIAKILQALNGREPSG